MRLTELFPRFDKENFPTYILDKMNYPKAAQENNLLSIFTQTTAAILKTLRRKNMSGVLIEGKDY